MVSFSFRRLLLVPALATAAMAVGCGDDTPASSQGDRSTPREPVPEAQSAEATVPNPHGVSNCLSPSDLSPDSTDVDAAQWFSYYADDDENVLPAPEIDAWEWKDSLIGFYSDAESASMAQGEIATPARRAGFAVTRNGNVLRIDAGAPEPADLAALEACLAEHATG